MNNVRELSQTTTTDILATDLDGTLIPMDGCSRNATDLAELARQLAESQVPLVFVTGRHLQSTLRAISQFRLPTPDWIVADVGTSIYERDGADGWKLLDGYAQHLQTSLNDMPLEKVRFALRDFDELTLQAEEKQGRFKLSYYSSRDQVHEVAKRLQTKLNGLAVPYGVTSSLDPFTTHGLIDVLPQAASKGAALSWWAERQQIPLSSIVYAGDSGNDLAALVAGFRSIVVANAEPDLVKAVERAHASAGWDGRLFIAEGHATSGVLQGCRWFGVFQ